MSEIARKLRAKLQYALGGADVQLAASVLHDLAKDYFLRYASEVAVAQYRCGVADGHSQCSAGKPFPTGKEIP